jgi:peptidoglycan/LPS O-acetylase OafA/YrhL
LSSAELAPHRTGSGLEQSPVFPVLDTLRAVGALCVVTTHVAFQSGDYVRHGIIGSLLSRLDVGVAIFFVLSGFLLSRPYLARAETGRPHPSTARYYWKRLVRIYPVYAVSVVIALLFIGENHRGDGFLGWVRALTLTDVFTTGRLPQGLTQMWSLSVEVTFYLVLPLLMLLLLGRGSAPSPRRIFPLLVIGTLFSCWWNFRLGADVDRVTSGTPLLWLPAHLTWFLVGISLAAAHVWHQTGSRSPVLSALVSLARMPGTCWTIAGGLMLVVATPLGGPILLLVATPTQSLVKHLTYALVAGLVVLTGLFTLGGSRYARVMSTPWLRHLGHISFSTFCIHLVVLQGVRNVLGHQLFSGEGLQIWVLTVLVSLAASEVLYRCVEKPGLRLKNLGPGRTTPTGEAQSATTTASTNH